jgi:hypothetical protein
MQRSASDWAGNIAAFVVVLVVNGLANGLPLGGQTTGEISARYPSLFTPAGFTFSIWGLIYLGLAAFVTYQALPGQRDNPLLADIGLPFKLSCAANAVWIFVWHYDQLLLSLVMMAGILVTLIVIYRAIGTQSLTGVEKLVVAFPFSVYVGWITVATIANISAVQTGWGWDAVGLSAVNWTLLKLAVAGAIGATVFAHRADIAYLGVIAWAAFGIVSKQGDTLQVAGAAATLSTLAVLLMAIAAVDKLRG